MADDLTALVRAAQAGDLDAFGQLVERFQRMACATAYRVVGDRHLAEDAAQEAFIEAYQCLGALRAPAAFPAWFRLVVRKRADRLARSGGCASVPIAVADQIPATQPGPAQIAETHELQCQVRQAVASLPAHDRQLVQLFHLDGYAQHEVAALVALPAAVVKKRLFRARQRLRPQLIAAGAAVGPGSDEARRAFVRGIPFFAAVRAGDLAAVQTLLADDPPLVGERERWDTTLAQHYRLPVVGAYTALHRVAVTGHQGIATLLLACGADPDARASCAQTPLHVAVLNDHPELVSLLLVHRADPNCVTDRGMTALHWAVIRRRRTMIPLLLRAGASAGARDAGGRTPRDWAAHAGWGLDDVSLMKHEE